MTEKQEMFANADPRQVALFKMICAIMPERLIAPIAISVAKVPFALRDGELKKEDLPPTSVELCLVIARAIAQKYKTTPPEENSVTELLRAATFGQLDDVLIGAAETAYGLVRGELEPEHLPQNPLALLLITSKAASEVNERAAAAKTEADAVIERVKH